MPARTGPARPGCWEGAIAAERQPAEVEWRGAIGAGAAAAAEAASVGCAARVLRGGVAVEGGRHEPLGLRRERPAAVGGEWAAPGEGRAERGGFRLGPQWQVVWWPWGRGGRG